MATVRDETRMPGDRCPRGSDYAPDRLVKAGFPAKLHFEFHHFPFRFQPPLAGRLFYHQPPAVVDPFRVILVCDRNVSKNSARSCR